MITFDHEPVDLAAVSEAAERGATLRPGPEALAFSDKAHQRCALALAGIAVPPFVVTEDPDDIDRFGDQHGWPIVVKAPIGGYDGRGVIAAPDPRTAIEAFERFDRRALLEPLLPLRAELSVVTVRTIDGEVAAYPAFDTVQDQGMCREVTVPSLLPDPILRDAAAIAARVAAVVGSVGVLAIELFVVGDDVLVNEVSPRPHNSGHLTIEACATSQFENHLRAVLGWPLGSTALVVPAAAMVNVVGLDTGHPIVSAAAGATVHDYRKSPRPGRKLGHVTVVADDLATAIESVRSTIR